MIQMTQMTQTRNQTPMSETIQKFEEYATK